MDIVIVSEFTESFSRDDNDRFLFLANLLAPEHEVELITGSFRHSTKTRRAAPESPWPFQITFLPEPGYPRNVCLRRFRSHRVWGRNLLAYMRRRRRPDVVYCAVPSLSGPSLLAKFCEKQNIRFVVDVQDLWPEAFRMALNLPVVSPLLFAPFSRLADGIYRRADAVCAVSESYCARALRVHSVPAAAVYLGVDLAAFDRFAAEFPLSRAPFAKGEGELLLVYAGTLGTSYDLPLVFSALRRLSRPDLRFLVVGSGPLESAFRNRAAGLNVSFLGRLPYERLCGVLAGCDLVVNPIVPSSAASIINKHGDYAAAGVPVLNTQSGAEYRDLVEQYRMGLNCVPGDPASLAENLETLLNDPALRLEMGRNARRCAEEKFDRAVTYPRLLQVIESRPVR